MRIIHTITDLDVGGAEMMLYRLLAVGDRSRWQPAVISLMKAGLIAERVAAFDVATVSLNMARCMPSPTMLFRLRRAARTLRGDLLQGWMYHGNIASTFANSVTRPRPVVWNVRHSLHDLAKEKPLSRALIRLGALLSRSPRAIIYNSRVSARQHEALGYAAHKTVVIPNGFDCQRFKPRPEIKAGLRQTLGIEPGTILIGMVARSHPMKDPLNLVRAAALLLADKHPIHLVIVGESLDASHEPINSALGELGIAGRVTLLGERHDIPKLVPGFDIAVLPSAWGEGFPNVLGEAMACGVPCVATDVGDCAWVVGDYGLIVPPRDSAALAGALGRMVEIGPEGRARLGAGARARVVEHFSIDEITHRYEALYEQCVGEAELSSCVA
ncbi:MAG: glycosyltransferase [Geminicoccaceae bacterium]